MRSENLLPLAVGSVLLLAFGLWWGLTVVAWLMWERRFASPAEESGPPEKGEDKPSKTSKLIDSLEFSLPSILSIGLAVDGVSGGRLLYAPGWTVPFPFADGIQVLGVVLLVVGLPLFTTGAYLTGKYVYSKRPEERTLLQRGPYAFVRHPIYLSFMLIGSGFILLSQNLIMLPLLYFFTAALYPREEEAELVKLFGDTYREYRARTGRFLPKLRRG